MSSTPAGTLPDDDAQQLGGERSDRGPQVSEHQSSTRSTSRHAPPARAHRPPSRESATTSHSQPALGNPGADQPLTGRQPSPPPQHRPDGDNQPDAHDAPVALDRPYDDRNIPAVRAQQQRTRHQPIARKTAATIKLSTWNMRGRGTDKWSHVNQIVRQRKIGVLCLQETHLNDEHLATIDRLFGKRLQIYHSAIPGHDTTQGGVAIVLNKELTNIKDVSVHEIVPGRALLLSLPWHDTLTMHILNVYAPNSPAANAAFWTSLRERLVSTASTLPIPDVVLGDFNLVEDARDRTPAHADAPQAVAALADLRLALHLSDAWRETYPDERLFTYHQDATGSRSRIDRVYLSSQLAIAADQWSMFPAPIPSDHRMVSLRIEDLKAPFIGRGRWTLPLDLLDDEIFLEEVESLGVELQQRIKRLPRTDDATPHARREIQRLWASFKATVASTARTYKRTKRDQASAHTRELKRRIDHLAGAANPSAHHSQAAELSDLEARLQDNLRAAHEETRLNVAAKHAALGGQINKYFVDRAKERTPRDLIYALSRPDPAGGDDLTATKSIDMAELAKDYHDTLQRLDTPELRPNHSENIAAVLTHVHTSPSPDEYRSLQAAFETKEFAAALQSSAPRRAAGPDGLPYELWKALDRNHKFKVRHDITPAFNVLRVLTQVANNVHDHGVDDSTGLAQGWIWHKYKDKGSRKNIKNYRPITLLNSDYKLISKVLTARLALTAERLIHPDQAGFVPNRSICDQVRLARLVPDYCEATEENGVLIALDQEKAYDRISHAYLWRALEAFHLPPSLIRMLRNIYSSARSYTIINGECSSLFAITRGVRQGDPVSCLLFDLAIEPLACMLRDSNLEGIPVANLRERLIARLFADDTATYLSARDRYEDLEDILLRWCAASGAKFNLDKTKIIPLGSPEYRASVCTTRRLQPDAPQLPPHLDIVPDGVATRYLGGWIGNHTAQDTPWQAVLDKINRDLARWERVGCTLDEARLVVSMVVGGRAQYLTKVHGMPKHVELQLVRRIRDFVWHGAAHPPVAIDVLYLPKEQGGLRLLDLPTRNWAIESTWLPGYLDLTPSRPTWAFLADVLFSEHAVHAHPSVPQPLRINTFLQLWHPTASAASSLPRDLRALLLTAKRCQLTFDALRPTREVKETLPAWYTIDVTHHLHRDCTRTVRDCLRDRHRVRSIGDLVKLNRTRRLHPDQRPHYDRSNCACAPCRHLRQEHDCQHPYRCLEHVSAFLRSLPDLWRPTAPSNADNLSLAPSGHDRNLHAFATDDKVLFDPSVTTPSLAACFRLFADPAARQLTTKRRNRFSLAGEAVTVYTDGSCSNNGALDADAGAGVYYGPDDPRNASLRVAGTTQSNQAGELAAVYHVAKTNVGLPGPLHIVTDSKYVIRTLTLSLPRLEQGGFIGTPNALYIQAIASWLRQRGAVTTLQWVKGHNDDPGNDAADRLAAAGAALPPDDAIPPELNPGFYITGIQLDTLTQRQAYRALRAQRHPPERRTTTVNLDMARYAVQHLTQVLPTDAALWRAVRHPDIQRKIQQWLWKLMHGAHRVGPYWERIPQLEHRARCQACHEDVESMEHILTECPASGQRTIWGLCEQLLAAAGLTWPRPSIGAIMGCGLLQHTVAGRPSKGPSRLIRIAVSESAYLAWLIRCERLFQRPDPATWHTVREVTARWHAAINRRLAIDQAMTNRSLLRHRALKYTDVLSTWRGTLYREWELDRDGWIGQPGVLVSIGMQELGRPPGGRPPCTPSLTLRRQPRT